MSQGQFDKQPVHWLMETIHDAALLTALHYLEIRDENPPTDKYPKTFQVFDEAFRKHLEAMTGMGQVERESYFLSAVTSDRR